MRSIALVDKWVTCLVQGCVIETRVTSRDGPRSSYGQGLMAEIFFLVGAK
jgi:hypothetical protein